MKQHRAAEAKLRRLAQNDYAVAEEKRARLEKNPDLPKAAKERKILSDGPSSDGVNR